MFLNKARNLVFSGFIVLLTGCSAKVPEDLAVDNVETFAKENVETYSCEKIEGEFERELCTLTVIGQLLEENKLEEKHCKVITNIQNQADCYAYISDSQHDLDVCFNIEDKKMRNSCLGDIKRVFLPQTKIKNIELCEKLQADDKWLWANQCRLSYVLKNEILDIQICNTIDYPLAFYNCVKNIAHFNEQSKMCEKIKEIEPFPKNYPPLVFSVSGCKYWVKNNKSYKGLN